MKLKKDLNPGFDWQRAIQEALGVREPLTKVISQHGAGERTGDEEGRRGLVRCIAMSNQVGVHRVCLYLSSLVLNVI